MNSTTPWRGRLSLAQRGVDIPPLEAVFYTAAGLLALLLGSWVPDNRLILAGLPLNTVLLAMLAIIATFSTIERQHLKRVLLAQAPFLFVGLTLFWSPDPLYGLDKFTTLVVTGNISFLLFNTVIERNGLLLLSQTLLAILSALFIATLIYKVMFGFFDRQVLFLMNGAIVFARLMALAAILAFFVLRGKAKFAVVSLFVLAILWSESKGPILGVISVIALAALFSATRRRRILVVSVIAIAVAAFYYFATYVVTDIKYLGRTGIFFALAAGDFGALEEKSVRNLSLLTRVEMWRESAWLITQEPLGVGLGGWSAALPKLHHAYYPHNLMFELLTECGVLVGSLAILPFITFLFARINIFSFIALFYLMAQLVSGDIGDARMLLVFSMLATFCKTKSSIAGNTPA